MVTATHNRVNGKVSESDLELIRHLSLPDKIIAQNLGITPSAVSMRIMRVATKLKVENRSAIIVKSLRIGLININQLIYRNFE